MGQGHQNRFDRVQLETILVIMCQVCQRLKNANMEVLFFVFAEAKSINSLGLRKKNVTLVIFCPVMQSSDTYLIHTRIPIERLRIAYILHAYIHTQPVTLPPQARGAVVMIETTSQT